MTDSPSNATDTAQPDQAYQRTTYAVWEITLKCNLACSHCGSRAGDSRVHELTTEEAFDLVHQMADAGIHEISLIGGEAFLRRDWLEIAKEITRCGIRATMTTGGFGISQNTADRMAEAGIRGVSVSVDGLEDVHDELRGRKGSWQNCFKTMEYLKNAGIPFGSNTQFNKLSAPQLPLLYQRLQQAGIKAWQIQMTVPMGNAADNNRILIQPFELLNLYPVIAHLAERGAREGVHVQAGNNIGYFGPYERRIRAAYTKNPYDFYKGCNAGDGVLGIEADGAIKGCPSLPTKPYTGGNIRDLSLVEIMKTEPLNINAKAGTPQGTDHLWGFCQSCEFASVCRGGCNWTSHVFFGRRGNNPYCIHRALMYAGNGRRERFRQKEAASGLPFDHGIFEIWEEGLMEPVLPVDKLAFSLHHVHFPPEWLEEDPDLKAKLIGERNHYIEWYHDRYWSKNKTGETVEV